MPATADEIGLSRSGSRQVRRFLATSVDRGEVAGAVGLVAGHDRVALSACVGLRDIEADRPMAPDTIFRIASMTKPIVSVGVLMLVEAGRLRLDDEVSRFIPEFRHGQVFAGVEHGRLTLAPLERPITVYDLLTHTSGLAYDAPHPSLAETYDDLGDVRDGPEMMRRLAGRPLAHQPGRDWMYGWSHNVLGRIIEVVADQGLDDYLATGLFTPLGMVDSGFQVPPGKIDRLAAVYESVEGRSRRVDTLDTRMCLEPQPLVSGGGGAVSTGPDYLRFTRMLLRGGELDGVRLLKTDTVQLMTRNHLAPPLYPLRFGDHVSEGEGYGLGVGVRVEISQPEMAGSEGMYQWGGAWNTHFWVDPARHLTGVFLCQSEPFTFARTAEAFRSQVYRALAA
jgi:CubicO group peptidase (beta-lactamase class C family)